MTGTAALVRLILRLDRVRIVIWMLAIALTVLSTVASIKGLYPERQDLEKAAVLVEDNASAIVLNGPAQGLNNLGGRVAFESGTFTLIAVGLMVLFTVGRHTRAEEESGRLELLRATVLGRHASTVAALVVAAAMSILVSAVVTLGLLGQDIDAAGSVLFGASLAAFGIFMAAVAIVAAQITENTRVVYGIGAAVLGVSWVVRGIGDIGDGTASWFSPIGWAQKTKPYAGDQWWPLLIVLGFAAVLVVVAARLAALRDEGAGLVPPRPGSPVASRLLSSPLGLAWRLQRASVFWWVAGIFALGIAYGSVGDAVEDFTEDNDAFEDMVNSMGADNLTDGFLATSLLMLSLIGSGFAISSAQRLRSEETAIRAEPILATGVSRWSWMASHVVIALVGSVMILVAAGFGIGLSYGIVVDDLGQVGRLTAASLAYIPAVWLLATITMTLFGLFPRTVLAAWGALVYVVLIGILGAVLDLPGWVMDASPFEQTSQVPAVDLRVLPLVVMMALTVVLGAAGFVGFRQRNVG